MVRSECDDSPTSLADRPNGSESRGRMGGVFVQEFNFLDEADTDDVIIEPDSWRFFRKAVYIILLNQTQAVFPLRDKEVGWVQSLQPHNESA